MAVAFWFLARHYDGLPQPLGRDAPASVFSAARADAVLERILGPEIAHSTASLENENVRARIVEEFAALGIATHIEGGFACSSTTHGNYIGCAAVHDIVADVIPGEGKAIILLAHYDSVPAGPGASDDEAGVAAIIETARALKVSGGGRHPVLAVMTDGEEAGLLGARYFLDNPDLKPRIGVVLNVEARGNQGPSLLFQTSDGNGKLIDLYAKNVGAYATSSLFPSIYKLIPNDTDLTLFLDESFPGLNFACIGNVADYHTPLDRRENLNLATLQHHGENLLGMARALADVDLADLGGEDASFLSVFGRWLPRLSAVWILPLSILTLAAVIGAWFLWKDEGSASRYAIFLPPVMIGLSALLGKLVELGVSFIAPEPDPSFAHPLSLRMALAFCVLFSTVMCARWASPRQAALVTWFWMALCATAAGIFLPGGAPYFLFPAIVGAVALLLRTRVSALAGDVLLACAAFAALAVWSPLVIQGEALMGLAVQLLFIIPATLAVLPLLPFIMQPSSSRAFQIRACIAVGTMIVAATIIAGLQPPYSTDAPQRLNISFIDDHIANAARWSIETRGSLPESFDTIAAFTMEKVLPFPLTSLPSYVADAGAVRFAEPTAAIEQTEKDGERRVTLKLDETFAANTRFVIVPPDSDLQAVEVDGHRFEPAANHPTVIYCIGQTCLATPIVLVLGAERSIDLTIGALRYGLPPDAALLTRARPATAVPSSTGDTTIVIGKITLAPTRPSSPL